LDKIASSNRISATQIGTYRLCPRKWGWNKLDGVPAPPNKYAERGLRVHKAAERWLEKGIPVDMDTEEGKIITPGLKFLPPPGTGLTEHMFNFATETAVYTGLWDLLVLPQKPFDSNEIPSVSVIDHKTTSDFKWMKKVSDLRTDPQAIIYAVAAGAGVFQHYGVNPYIVLNWIYYRANAKKPGARKVTLYVLPDDAREVQQKDTKTVGAMSWSELMEQFADIEVTAAELLEHRRQGHKAIDLPYNIAGCKAFGGCPYAGNPCRLNFKDVLEGHMKQDIVSKAIAAQSGQNTQQDAAAQPVEQSLAAKIAARTAVKAKPAAQEADPAVVTQTQAAVGAAVPAVNPPGEAEPVQDDVQVDVDKQFGPEKLEEPTVSTSAVQRLGTAVEKAVFEQGAYIIAQGIVSARLFNHNGPEYVDEVAHLAVEIADKVAEVSKK